MFDYNFHRRLGNAQPGQRSNDYRSRPLPAKCVDDPPPLPDGHPNGDPLYMDLDQFRREPPPPYTELNLQQAGAAAEQSYENPAFDSNAATASPASPHDMPAGVAPPPPGINQAQIDAGGGYLPYLKNNADQEGVYMTPDGPSTAVDDSFYEIANA